MVKIKVPKDVSYGCFTYKVYLDPTQDESGFGGSTLFDKEEIRINPTIPNSRKLTAFIHENTHLINKAHNLDLSEHETELLANGFAELLARNLGIELDWSDVPTLKLVVEEKGDKGGN